MVDALDAYPPYEWLGAVGWISLRIHHFYFVGRISNEPKRIRNPTASAQKILIGRVIKELIQFCFLQLIGDRGLLLFFILMHLISFRLDAQPLEELHIFIGFGIRRG